MRRKKSINVVLAEALKHYMGDHWTPYSLAKKSGVAEGTIRNYLAPEKRQPSASGKEPSAKLTEVEMLAEALGVEFCDLTTDATEAQRLKSLRERAAAFYAQHGELPEWAPKPVLSKQPSRIA